MTLDYFSRRPDDTPPLSSAARGPTAPPVSGGSAGAGSDRYGSEIAMARPSGPQPAGQQTPQQTSAFLPPSTPGSPMGSAAGTPTAAPSAPTAPPASSSGFDGDALRKVGVMAGAVLVPGFGQGYVQGAQAKAQNEAQRASTQMALERHQVEQRQRKHTEAVQAFLRAVDYADDPILGPQALQDPGLLELIGEDAPIPKGVPLKLEQGPQGTRFLMGTPDGGWAPLMVDGQPAMVPANVIENMRMEVDPTYRQKQLAESGAQMEQRLLAQREDLTKKLLANQITKADYDAQVAPIDQQIRVAQAQRSQIGAERALGRAPVVEEGLDEAALTQQVLSRRQRAEQYHQEVLDRVRRPVEMLNAESQAAIAPWLNRLARAQAERTTLDAEFDRDNLMDMQHDLAKMTLEQQHKLLPTLQEMERIALDTQKGDVKLANELGATRRGIERRLMDHQSETLGVKIGLENAQLGEQLNSATRQVLFNTYMAGRDNPGLALDVLSRSSLIKFDGNRKPEAVDMAYGPQGAQMAFTDKNGSPLSINGQPAVFSRTSLEALVDQKWNRLSDYAIFNQKNGQVVWFDGVVGGDPKQVDKWITDIRNHLNDRYRSTGMFQMMEDTQQRRNLTSAANALALRLVRDGVFSDPVQAASVVADATEALVLDSEQRKAQPDHTLLEPFFRKYMQERVGPMRQGAAAARPTSTTDFANRYRDPGAPSAPAAAQAPAPPPAAGPATPAPSVSAGPTAPPAPNASYGPPALVPQASNAQPSHQSFLNAVTAPPQRTTEDPDRPRFNPNLDEPRNPALASFR